jgi:hypothetical protein
MFGSSLRACLIGLVAVVAVSASPGFARAAGNRIDSGGVVGRMSSITIGSDDLGLISYYDGTNGDLKVAHCLDVACSAATTTAIDTNGDVGLYTSITIGSDGLGLISYYNLPSADLNVLHCSTPQCLTP